ncbi:MAG: hypothetical protein H7X80_05120, partial [bacterium]|nr:hypothetical protein [Candidatus Kapabacteria bacterium]
MIVERRSVIQRVATALLITLALATACAVVSLPAAAQTSTTSTIIVKLRPNASPKSMIDRATAQSNGGLDQIRIRRAIEIKASALLSTHSLDRYFIATVPSVQADKALNALRRDPDVESVTPNHTYRLHGSGFDPLAMEQWAHRRIEADGAWEYTLGSDSIIIAFVDTGIDYLHPDLSPSLWINIPEDRNANGRLDAWPSDELRDGVEGD